MALGIFGARARRALRFGLIASIVLAAGSANGQPKQASSPSAPPASSVVIPDDSKLTLLIQLSMAALALGNLSGEYGALHALTTTEFKRAHPVAELSDAFRPYRTATTDISPLLLYPPVLFGRPSILGNGEVAVSGRYETLPQHIHFALRFQPEDGAWRVSFISINLVTPAAPVAAESAPKPNTKSAAAKGRK